MRSIENHVDQTIQTDPSLDNLFVPISEKGIQTVSDVSNIGIQVNPPLTVDTSVSDVVTVFRNIDLSDLGSVFISDASASIQAVPELKSTGVQTLVTNLDQGLQTMINPGLKVNADLTEFGIISTQTSPIKELTDNSVQTLVKMLDKGIQTKPDMKIDLTSVMINKVDPFFPLIDPSIDLDLVEAYIPYPGMVVDVATSMANYYPLCMG